MDVATITLTIAMMGLIILFGTLVAIRMTVTEDTKKLLMAVIINIAVPFIILNGVFNTEITDEVLQQVVIVFIVSIIFNSSAILFSIIVLRMFRFQWSKAKKLSLLAAIGNTGFIAIPLCAAIFGPIGGLLAAVFDAGLDVILFTLGVFILQSDNQKFSLRQLKELINMPVIAIAIGLTFAVSGLEAPRLFQDLAGMLSGLAAPLAMLYIGFLLPPFFRQNQRILYRGIQYPLFIRLLFIPSVMILLLSLLDMDPFLRQLFVILSAMPTFMLAPVIYSRYTNEEDTAAMTTVVSTLLSLFTIPLITWVATLLFS
ncbi:hypothetical protein JCM19037_4469 [Geomicrobium sp. JCM 19037]|uniref:AEC family transporter n=1 Tax=unclassified Geomicrobium TaxID=2628951 RepID=UPI00045F14D4|nr:AEC family transporter [Geomicrobium sp. JCM 19037]GAK05931.1 hypothetical protein JCM19037_4469 [Geomicrobium sp. JCM 19037]